MSEVTQSCPILCDPMDCSRLLHLWDFPSKNTGEDCHFLLQEIFPTQGLNPRLLHCRQTLNPLSHQGSPIKRSLMRSKTTSSYCVSVCPSGCSADHFTMTCQTDSICVISITMARVPAGFPLLSVPVSLRMRLRKAWNGFFCVSFF